MATAKPDTGHGASITFGTTAWSGKLRGITSNVSLSVPVVDISHLGTTGQRETMPGDLQDIGPVEADVLFESVTGLPAIGTVETITITYPLQSSGATTAANHAGTAYIMDVQFPPMLTNQEMIARIKFQFDGFTGPTFTAAS